MNKVIIGDNVTVKIKGDMKILYYDFDNLDYALACVIKTDKLSDKDKVEILKGVIEDEIAHATGNL